MRKLILVMVALGLLTIGIGGCGSGEEVAESPTEETPTVESSPTPPEAETGAEPEQAAEGETAEEPEKEAFEEPLVEQQKEETAAKAGLIQSTKPEERLNQLKGSTNGNGTAAASAEVAEPSVSDPFGVLPPLVVQRTPDPEEAAESLDLAAREVPSLPEVPIAAVPPQWTVAAVPPPQRTVPLSPAPGTGTLTPPRGTVAPTPSPQRTGGNTQQADQKTGPVTPPPPPAPSIPENLTARQVPSLPELPPAERPPQAGRPPAQRPTPTLQPNPTPAGANRSQPSPPTQSPTRTAQQTPASPPPPPPPPAIPDLTVAVVPALPELPAGEPIPQWRDPNPPPPPPPTPVVVVPPPPSVEIAKAISVSGVMRVGDETRVILKAPNEPTSRYVNVGERVANGEVLVKRVKFNVGGDPIVIFEQNGVEVAIEVGTFSETEEQLNLIEPSSPGVNTSTPS